MYTSPTYYAVKRRQADRPRLHRFVTLLGDCRFPSSDSVRGRVRNDLDPVGCPNGGYDGGSSFDNCDEPGEGEATCQRR